MTGLQVVEVNMIVEGVQYRSEKDLPSTPEAADASKPYEYKNYRIRQGYYENYSTFFILYCIALVFLMAL